MSAVQGSACIAPDSPGERALLSKGGPGIFHSLPGSWMASEHRARLAGCLGFPSPRGREMWGVLGMMHVALWLAQRSLAALLALQMGMVASSYCSALFTWLETSLGFSPSGFTQLPITFQGDATFLDPLHPYSPQNPRLCFSNSIWELLSATTRCPVN